MLVNNQNFNNFKIIYSYLCKKEKGKNNYSMLSSAEEQINIINQKINSTAKTRTKKASMLLETYENDKKLNNLDLKSMSSMIDSFKMIYKALQIADGGMTTNFLKNLENLLPQEQYIAIQEHIKTQDESGRSKRAYNLLMDGMAMSIKVNCFFDENDAINHIRESIEKKCKNVNSTNIFFGFGTLFHNSSDKKIKQINELMNYEKLKENIDNFAMLDETQNTHFKAFGS